MKSTGRTLLLVGLAAAVIAGGIWTWEEVLEDRLIPKRWGVVVPGAVYRSGQLHRALVEETLREHSIRRIVSLRPDEPDNPDHAAERRAAERLGIEWVVFPLRGDGRGDLENYALALESIVDATQREQPVLVHCAAGAYRAGGVVAMYRILIQGKAPSEAWSEMREYDWDPDDEHPARFLNENMAELVRLLVDNGVLEAAPDPLPVLAP